MGLEPEIESLNHQQEQISYNVDVAGDSLTSHNINTREAPIPVLCISTDTLIGVYATVKLVPEKHAEGC